MKRKKGYKDREATTASSSALPSISSSPATLQRLRAEKSRRLSLNQTYPPFLQPKKMRPLAFLLPVLAAASPVSPGVVPDGWADAPDPKDIQIESVRFSGNGCPQGTVSYTISPDKTVTRPTC